MDLDAQKCDMSEKISPHRSNRIYCFMREKKSQLKCQLWLDVQKFSSAKISTFTVMNVVVSNLGLIRRILASSYWYCRIMRFLGPLVGVTGSLARGSHLVYVTHVRELLWYLRANIGYCKCSSFCALHIFAHFTHGLTCAKI